MQMIHKGMDHFYRGVFNQFLVQNNKKLKIIVLLWGFFKGNVLLWSKKNSCHWTTQDSTPLKILKCLVYLLKGKKSNDLF